MPGVRDSFYNDKSGKLALPRNMAQLIAESAMSAESESSVSGASSSRKPSVIQEEASGASRQSSDSYRDDDHESSSVYSASRRSSRNGEAESKNLSMMETQSLPKPNP